MNKYTNKNNLKHVFGRITIIYLNMYIFSRKIWNDINEKTNIMFAFYYFNVNYWNNGNINLNCNRYHDSTWSRLSRITVKASRVNYSYERM